MRNRNLSELLCICMLSAFTLVTVASAQDTTPQAAPSSQASPTSQTPQAAPEQPQSEPSQQNPAANPAPETQPNATGQTSPNPAPPSQSAPPASAQQGNQGQSIDEELQLTSDQKQKIAAVVDDENKQISAVRDDNSLSLDQKQQKVLQIRQAGSPKIKSILTPEQLQKLAVIQQRMREQNGSQSGTQSGGQTGTQGQGTTQTPPQH